MSGHKTIVYKKFHGIPDTALLGFYNTYNRKIEEKERVIATHPGNNIYSSRAKNVLAQYREALVNIEKEMYSRGLPLPS